MKVGVSIFSFAFTAGQMRPLARPALDVFGLMDKAQAHGLAGVEFNPSAWAGQAEQVRAYAQARGLSLFAATGGTDPHTLARHLEIAAALGSPVLRTTVTRVLAGDRRALADQWPRLMAEAADNLRQVAPVAERLGICIAIENHQDLTSTELVDLMKSVGSPFVGITLDTGNPLGVAEHPLDFTAAVAPYVRHLHIKDYRVYLTESGYRLVRCAIGEGVIDFPALLVICAERCPYPLAANIEIGALHARHVRVLEDDFWAGYPPREAPALARTLRLVNLGARPAGEPWQTPWEADLGEDAVIACEEEAFVRSLAYVQKVFRPAHSA